VFYKTPFSIVIDADAAKNIAQKSWSDTLNKIWDLKESQKFESWAINMVNRKAIERRDNELNYRKFSTN
jgi:RNA polymerase sigma-70 factor (ECF subfamily)